MTASSCLLTTLSNKTTTILPTFVATGNWFRQSNPCKLCVVLPISSQRGVYMCGGGTGGGSDPCSGSTATCDSVPDYGCMCTGSNIPTSSCEYCQIRTANAIFCQVTGSSTTFVPPKGGLRSCSCEYPPSGAVNQTCSTPTEGPTPAPTLPTGIVPTSTPPPQTVPATPAPQVMVPTTTPAPQVIPAITPAPQPIPATPAPQVPAATLAPISNPTMAPVQPGPGCLATFPYNVFMCVGTSEYCNGQQVSCSIMPSYACSCSSAALNPAETMCNYCEIRTINAVICQVTGNTMSFTAPDFSTRTCSCEYVGNGQVQQSCYSPPPALATQGGRAGDLGVAAAPSWDMP